MKLIKLLVLAYLYWADISASKERFVYAVKQAILIAKKR